MNTSYELFAKDWFRPSFSIGAHIYQLIKWHIGYAILLCIAKKPEKIKCRKPKKVLILGTGPSLDWLTHDLIKEYDTFIVLNHAISHPLIKTLCYDDKQAIWFSADPFRLNECIDNIIAGPSSINLYLHCNLGNVVKMVAQQQFRDNITFIKPYVFKDSYLYFLRTGSWYTGFHHSTRETLDCCIRFLKFQTSAIPLIYMSSLFPAILLVARLGAVKIDLLGCDLNDSRTTALAQQLGKADFETHPHMKRILKNLISLLSLRHINLHNLSWNSKHR